MDFTITIDDSLVPGIIATASLEGISPEEVVGAYATSMATKVCQDLKVGPYYAGPVDPQFNADGTPYGQPEPAPEVNWEWPDSPERFDTFTAPDGSEWVYDQPRADDGTYLADDPETAEIESALQWLPAIEGNETNREATP